MARVNVPIVVLDHSLIVFKALVFLVQLERSPMEMDCVFLVRSDHILLMSVRFNATDVDVVKNLTEP